jgi:primosomal protein N' (replication factor Y)
MIGLIVDQGSSRIPVDRLRPILKVLDAAPILSRADLELMRWASQYYHHPLGEVIGSALPKRVRDGHTAAVEGVALWRLSSRAADSEFAALRRAPRQQALLSLLTDHPQGLRAAEIEAHIRAWRQPLAKLVAKDLVTETSRPCLEPSTVVAVSPLELNADQQAATVAILATLRHFAPFVLEGVTGSGKTEVYLKVIESVVAAGCQALVLVPEIGLTPQLVARFQARFAAPLAVMHSSLSDGERHCAWHMARTGKAPIIIGTRSAVFTPLGAPGIVIVDEEHDGSFKQQDGFRYHARDLALVRGRLLRVPVVLGSATPSLESLCNVEKGRYRHVRLPKRAGPAQAPTMEIVDVRRRPLEHGLSPHVLAQVGRHLQAGDQVLLFLNRRGYAPAFLCHDCGWSACCRRCDVKLTLHAARHKLCCHHCGAEQSVTRRCPACGSEALLTIGEGTEQVERALEAAFPGVPMVRIDRDTTRRKGELQDKLAHIAGGTHRLLVGTQMLAKGHDFPQVTLVVILNVDQGIYSSDFRAAERTAQLIVQVAGRAGRGERPGRVVLQTHQPDHPLLKDIMTGGYQAFSRAALSERRLAGLPPYRYMALMRAEAVRRDASLNFLRSAQVLMSKYTVSNVSVIGPAPAPMERRAGRFRAQLMLIARSRTRLQRLLDVCVAQLHDLPNVRSVRWSLDVDPIDIQ